MLQNQANQFKEKSASKFGRTAVQRLAAQNNYIRKIVEKRQKAKEIASQEEPESVEEEVSRPPGTSTRHSEVDINLETYLPTAEAQQEQPRALPRPATPPTTVRPEGSVTEELPKSPSPTGRSGPQWRKRRSPPSLIESPKSKQTTPGNQSIPSSMIESLSPSKEATPEPLTATLTPEPSANVDVSGTIIGRGDDPDAERPEPKVPARKPRRRIPYNVRAADIKPEVQKRTREEEGKLTPDYFDFDKLEQMEVQVEKRSLTSTRRNLDVAFDIQHKLVQVFNIASPQPPPDPKYVEKHTQATVDCKNAGTQYPEPLSDSDSDVELIDGVPCKQLCMADKDDGSEQLGPTKVDENGFYKLRKGMTSDSGAGDTVGPEDDYPDYPLEPSPGSHRGLHYVAAGGNKIKNKGQKRVLILTKEKQLRWVTVQIAQVKKTLASVSKSNDNGFDVVYSKNASYMEEMSTKQQTALRRDRGVFVLDAWIVPYEMIKKGYVIYTDENGRKRRTKLNRPESSFARPAP